MLKEYQIYESDRPIYVENSARMILKAVAGFLIVSVLLMLPLKASSYPPTPRLSVEAVFLAGLMISAGALSFKRRGWIAFVLAACVLAILLLKLAIVAVRMALDRPLNLSLDWVLLGSVYDLSIGTFGPIAGSLLCLAGLILILILWWLVTWSLKSLSSLAILLRTPMAVGLGVALVLSGMAFSKEVWPGWTRGHLAGIGNRAI